MTHKEIDNIS